VLFHRSAVFQCRCRRSPEQDFLWQHPCPPRVGDEVHGPAAVGSSSLLGLAGNQLTGDLPFSLINATCIYQLALQRPVSACRQRRRGAVSSNAQSSNAWQKASCAPCAQGFVLQRARRAAVHAVLSRFLRQWKSYVVLAVRRWVQWHLASATPSFPCVKCPPGSSQVCLRRCAPPASPGTILRRARRPVRRDAGDI
jgi:hypothetical protein